MVIYKVVFGLRK